MAELSWCHSFLPSQPLATSVVVIICYLSIFIFLFLLVMRPNVGYSLLIHEVFLDHTQPTQHSR